MVFPSSFVLRPSPFAPKKKSPLGEPRGLFLFRRAYWLIGKDYLLMIKRSIFTSEPLVKR
jgi:hypothetical protein